MWQQCIIVLNILNTQKCESDLVLIGGDFNSRTGTLSDFVIEDERDLPFLPENYELDTHLTRRNNEDISINRFGEQLIDFVHRQQIKNSEW